MSDEDVPDAHAPPNPTATATTPASSNAPFAKTASLDEGSDALSDSDSDNAGGGPAGAAGGGPPTPHPFLRSASSAADEKVDDWVRTSRHRMLADASVNSAPDLCRALILYKPVGPSVPSTASEAATTCEGEDGDGEGGGDPTPSPQAGGDGGGEIAPAVGAGLGATKRGAEQRGPDGSEQSAGSSTAEAAGFTGGGGRTDQPNSYGNGHTNQRVAGSLFAPRSRGLCTTQSGGDAAGGARVVRDSNSSSSGMLLAREESVEMMQARSDSDVDRAAAAAASSTDAMEMDAAGDEGVGGNRESWDMAPPEAPVLTRVGTSRGAPTPELTPERAAWARVSGSWISPCWGFFFAAVEEGFTGWRDRQESAFY